MDITALRDEFAKLHKEAGDVVSAASKENRGLTAEEKEANDKRYARLDAIKGIVDEQSRFAKLALEAGHVEQPKAPAGRDEYENSPVELKADRDNFDLGSYKRYLNHFARTGELRRDLFTVTTSTGSGAYLPKQVLQPVSVRRLNNAFRAVLDASGYSPIEIGSVVTVSIPVADDTANIGQAQSQSANSGTELDPSDASLSIAPTLYGSKQFWYSNSMILAGSGFDILGFVLPMAQKRIDKIQESAWTTSLLGSGSVGKTTAATTGITYSELLDWEHSLAPAYRSDACFMVSDSLYKALRGLVDDNHRPIMDLDPTNQFVGKIHGKPVVVNDYLQTMAAGHKVGAFVSGDAVKIVDVANARLARYSLVPGHPDQTGFELFVNGDMGFVSSGVSLLATAAS